MERPHGQITSDQLPVCQAIAADSKDRLRTLEQKSTTLLSVIAIVAPLTASAAVFIKKQPLPPWAAAITLVFDFAAAVGLLLAFIAILRALAVRGHQELFLGTVIDPENDTIRTYDPDFGGRGLLWTAANRQATCDHIADFVRAAQVFLVGGVMLTVLAAVPVLAVVGNETQRIEGRVSLDTATLTALGGQIERAISQQAREMSDLRRAVDSLRVAPPDPRVTGLIDPLRSELARALSGGRQGKRAGG
jgi:hypothetical protein